VLHTPTESARRPANQLREFLRGSTRTSLDEGMGFAVSEAVEETLAQRIVTGQPWPPNGPASTNVQGPRGMTATGLPVVKHALKKPTALLSSRAGWVDRAAGQQKGVYTLVTAWG
jgi:hypothetical protein